MRVEHTSLQFSQVLMHVIWGYHSQELHVIITVKPCHLCVINQWRPLHTLGLHYMAIFSGFDGFVTYKHIHLLVQVIIHNQAVRHANTVRLQNL